MTEEQAAFYEAPFATALAKVKPMRDAVETGTGDIGGVTVKPDRACGER
jgi:hypothetical protein